MRGNTYNKGRKHSVEETEKRKQSRKGYSHSEETRKKIGNANKLLGLGRKLSAKTIQKMMGRTPWNKGTKGVMIAWNKGKPNVKIRGKNHHFWRGGVTPINLAIRGSLEYKLWREAVFKRDDYTCQECGERGFKLNADHIKPFSLFPELRFAIDNGQTLCVECHRKTPTYGKGVLNYFKSI